MKKQLGRTKQCEKCPWKKSTNPRQIPNGYSVKLHKNLSCTIAMPGSMNPTHSMACHESKTGRDDYCVGWLKNQLGPGNNIPLRIQMLNCDLSKLETVGPQHECFEATLPKRQRLNQVNQEITQGKTNG